jgi:transcriptional regulator with XRE-family HTH domain
MSKTENRKAVAAEVRAAAGRAGMKQSDLVRLTSISRQSLSRKWNEETPFMVDELIEIARALNIPASHLLPDAEQRIAA